MRITQRRAEALESVLKRAEDDWHEFADDWGEHDYGPEWPEAKKIIESDFAVVRRMTKVEPYVNPRIAKESVKLVETIARMTKGGECDDAFDTLQNLITRSRKIVRGG